MRPVLAIAMVVVVLVVASQAGAIAGVVSDSAEVASAPTSDPAAALSADTYGAAGIGSYAPESGPTGSMSSLGDAADPDAADVVVAALESAPGGSVVFLAGYSRYDTTDPLEHGLRVDIRDAVIRAPGVQLAGIVERTDAPASTVRYHARVLVEGDILRSAKVWGTLRYYPADVDDGDLELIAALRDDTMASVVEAVARHEPAAGTTLADELDRAPSTVSYHLSRLEEADLVERERVGEAVHTALTPAVRDAFADADGPAATPTAVPTLDD